MEECECVITGCEEQQLGKGITRSPFTALISCHPSIARNRICPLRRTPNSGLVDRGDDLVDDLSFAERRRLCWACAITQWTPLVLADDVARGLTSEEALALVAVARDLAADGQTIILTSDEPLLDAAIDRAIPIRDGYVDVRTGERQAPCDAVAPAR